MADGAKLETEGRRFSHYVGPYQFWFFLHKAPGRVGMVVSHYDSGKRVLDVPHHMIAACCNDTKSAAKMALDKLIERAGAERVRSVLAGA